MSSVKKSWAECVIRRTRTTTESDDVSATLAKNRVLFCWDIYQRPLRCSSKATHSSLIVLLNTMLLQTTQNDAIDIANIIIFCALFLSEGRTFWLLSRVKWMIDENCKRLLFVRVLACLGLFIMSLVWALLLTWYVYTDHLNHRRFCWCWNWTCGT